MTEEKAKRLVARRNGSERYYLGDGRISAEDIAWLLEKLTGRKATAEEIDACRRTLAGAHDKLPGGSR